ncbi:hypothetical protein T05_15495 [Trichinella murrelli]|uniref:Uncharacterized protein n=1 Tax=Trichinella murrelli TaxID=144512 RepID=A0A0V0TIN4_9BILA|nr:hypothetical protein T05_15495 [Trichinella murrelli]
MTNLLVSTYVDRCPDEARTEEIALKWMTGIVVSLAFILVLTFTFLQLQRIRKRNLALRHKLNLGSTSSANLL